MQRVQDYDKVGLTPEQEDFIANRSLLCFHSDSDNLTVVHGGIASGVGYLPSQPVWHRLAHHEQRNWKHLLFTRFEDEEGYPVPLDAQKPHHVWWADKYNGRFGQVVFGHQAYDEQDYAEEFPYALGIDLGCVYGNRLGAAIFIDGVHSETLTVKAQRTYRQHSEDTYDTP